MREGGAKEKVCAYEFRVMDDKARVGVGAQFLWVFDDELAAKEAVEVTVVELLAGPHRRHRATEVQQVKLRGRMREKRRGERRGEGREKRNL